MGMGSTGGGGGAISEINVTPLVDVMLVLLIIFMITATLARPLDDQERLLDMDLPRTQDTPTQVTAESDKLILRIDASLLVRINDDQIADCSYALRETQAERFESCFEEIKAQLLAHERVMAEGELYILADPMVPYGFVAGTLHRIGEVGITKVGMVTNPEFLTVAAPPPPGAEGGAEP